MSCCHYQDQFKVVCGLPLYFLTNLAHKGQTNSIGLTDDPTLFNIVQIYRA